MIKNEKLFTALISPSKQLEGQWIAHCLELDVVTQGCSIPNAIEMIAEAIVLCITDDIENGLDPLKRKRAPYEFWKKYSELAAKMRIVSNSNKIPNTATYVIATLRRAQCVELYWVGP